MNYTIKPATKKDNYLEITIDAVVTKEVLHLHLPAWRPGRYQMQNFAKNVRNFEALDDIGNPLPWKKVSKDCWQVKSGKAQSIKVHYQYYANQKDAGGSYFDASMLYVNPINCCMYNEATLEKPQNLVVQFPNNKKVACGLPYQKDGEHTSFIANSFHQLVDAPLIMSNTLQHKTYYSHNIPFHIWVQGHIEINWDQMLIDFKAFTDAQISIFGEFPEETYHFMLWVPPIAYYHGVEHYNSTMMVLGPDSQKFEDMYVDLLGLSSHELFHTWNVKRIRPKELLPYRYNEENYFETCFVSEGLTTFYGDWMLYRSGVFDRKQFQKELETTLKRHFDFADKSTLSLLESSFDLWLDGYEAGAPNRKVSVYHKGAVAAILLNTILKDELTHEYPLDLIMKELWSQFGKPYIGFTYSDYKSIAESVAKKDLNNYFKTVIEGNESLYKAMLKALAGEGFVLKRNAENKVFIEDAEEDRPKG